MASPQREHGYTAIANELLEQIVRRRFGANELSVILWISRKSYGWNSKTTNALGVRQMADEMNFPPSSVIWAVRVLLAQRVILRDDKDRYSINKDYESWLSASINSDQPISQQPPAEVTNPLVKTDQPISQSDQPIGHSNEAKANTKAKNKQVEGFEEFWKAYPVRKGKAAAMKSWATHVPAGTLPTILAAIKAQAQEKAALTAAGKFVPEWPHPKTWLNQKRWEDEITQGGTNAATRTPSVLRSIR